MTNLTSYSCFHSCYIFHKLEVRITCVVATDFTNMLIWAKE